MKEKREGTNWKRIFATQLTNKGLLARIYRGFLKLIRKQQRIQQTMGKKYKQEFHRGENTDDQ